VFIKKKAVLGGMAFFVRACRWSVGQRVI